MVRVSSGGNAYLSRVNIFFLRSREGRWTYQDKNATMNPIQEKKKVLPYLLRGFNSGMDRALPLRGLISGAAQSMEGLNPCLRLFKRDIARGSDFCVGFSEYAR